MRILFMGHGKWACITLESLVKAKHDVVGVVCELDSFDNKEDAHYKRFSSRGLYASLKDIAKKLGLKVMQPEDVNSSEFIKTIQKHNPELIVMVSYHAIIRDDLLNIYKGRMINVHGAPLPYYRGRAPINWAIINGEDHTGVTVHYIAKEVDQGDIIAQEIIPIKRSDTAAEILQKTLDSYPRLTLKALELISSNKVKRVKQDPAEGCYFPRRKEEDGLIDWSWRSEDIYNFVRALTYPYHGAFTYYKGKKLIIWNASLPSLKEAKRVSPICGIAFGRTKENYRLVTTGDSYIIIERAQFEGETNVEQKSGDIIFPGGKFFRNAEDHKR